MEKKAPIKIDLGTAIIAIIAVFAIIISIVIYIQKSNSDKEVAKLQKEARSSQNKIDELQGKLDSMAELTNNTDNNASEKKDDRITDYFVLYNGCEMPKKIGHINFGFINGLNEQNKKKYNITYNNYEKGKDFGETKGNLIESVFDNSAEVENVKKIATSKKYNAIPRTFKKIEQLPNELIDMADCTTIDIHSIDLDGDGTEEKIVCDTVNYQRGVAIGDGEPQASSDIMLFDSKYKKIADLVTLENGFWGNIKEEDKKVFLSLDNVEYFDIDNDGIMEILIEIPTYEQEGGANLSVLKYNKGKLEGETNIQASVLP